MDIDQGDVIRIGATMKYDNVYEVTNVYHCLVHAGGNRQIADAVEDIQEYMDTIMADIDTYLVNNMTADYLSVSNATQDLVFGSIDWGVFAQGGAATAGAALGCCVLAYCRTYVPRVQIRKYYGVFSVSNWVDGVWDAGLRNACSLAMAAHIDNFVGANGTGLMGVAFNRATKGYVLPKSVVVAPEVAYQRRRKRGRGS